MTRKCRKWLGDHCFGRKNAILPPKCSYLLTMSPHYFWVMPSHAEEETIRLTWYTSKYPSVSCACLDDLLLRMCWEAVIFLSYKKNWMPPRVSYETRTWKVSRKHQETWADSPPRPFKGKEFCSKPWPKLYCMYCNIKRNKLARICKNSDCGFVGPLPESENSIDW